MRKLLLAMALTPFIFSTAQSADLPARVYTKAPPPPPTYSWTGFYAGVNVGYGFNDPTVTYTANDPAAAFVLNPIAPASYDVKGVLGGAQIGYNWQVSPVWILGLEADLQGADIKGSALSLYTTGLGFPFQTNAQQNVEWFGTLRARAGWLANDKLLLFATGGLAYGAVHEDVALGRAGAGGGGGAGSTNSGFSIDCTNGTANPCFVGSRTQILVGYAAGAGVEYAAWQNVTIKLEYLYVNLGSSNTTATAVTLLTPGAIPASANAHFSDLDFNVVRAGMNWRF